LLRNEASDHKYMPILPLHRAELAR
jgi:hypothetical protein